MKVTPTYMLPCGNIAHVKTFADRLKYARKVRHVSTDDLDSGLGHKSRGYTSNLESPNRPKGPRLENAVKIARLLNVDLGWLITGDGPVPREGDDIANVYAVDPNDPMPERAMAVAIARRIGVPEWAIELSQERDVVDVLIDGEPPNRFWWLSRILSELEKRKPPRLPTKAPKLLK